MSDQPTVRVGIHFHKREEDEILRISSLVFQSTSEEMWILAVDLGTATLYFRDPADALRVSETILDGARELNKKLNPSEQFVLSDVPAEVLQQEEAQTLVPPETPMLDLIDPSPDDFEEVNRNEANDYLHEGDDE